MPDTYSEAFVEFLAELGAAESPEFEFKEAGGGIPQSLWETVCAFANTSGGTIVLGVRGRADDLEVVGVRHARQRVDDLYSQARSQNKISKDVLSHGEVTIASVDERGLIVISIGPADRRARPIFLNGQMYGGSYLVKPHAERHEFRTTLPYEHRLSAEDRAWLEAFDAELTDVEQLALVIARQGGGGDNQAVRTVTGAHGADVGRVLTGLRDRGFLVMVGNKRGARYFLQPASSVDSGPSLGDSASSSGDFTPSLVDSGSSLGVTEPDAETHVRLRRIAARAMASPYLSREVMRETIVQLCHAQPLTVREIAGLLNRTEHHMGQIVRELVADGKLRPLASGRRLNQRYVVPEKG